MILFEKKILGKSFTLENIFKKVGNWKKALLLFFSKYFMGFLFENIWNKNSYDFEEKEIFFLQFCSFKIFPSSYILKSRNFQHDKRKHFFETSFFFYRKYTLISDLKKKKIREKNIFFWKHFQGKRKDFEKRVWRRIFQEKTLFLKTTFEKRNKTLFYFENHFLRKLY